MIGECSLYFCRNNNCECPCATTVANTELRPLFLLPPLYEVITLPLLTEEKTDSEDVKLVALNCRANAGLPQSLQIGIVLKKKII